MIKYKVIKGTRRALYIKGLKSNYFYMFCFIGAIGGLGILSRGFKGGFFKHIMYAFFFVVALYGLFIFLSLDKPFKKVKKKYTIIQNIDLIKILKK